jgi:hypothetical protein
MSLNKLNLKYNNTFVFIIYFLNKKQLSFNNNNNNENLIEN